MRVTIIAAIGRNGEMGQGGKLPWHLPADLQFFKETTLHHPVIMGRVTWDGLPKRPLPNRTNIVVTSQWQNADKCKQGDGAWFVENVDQAIVTARELGASEVFIIGGAQVYKAAMSLADRLILTHVRADFPEADTFFPKAGPEGLWKFTTSTAQQFDNGLSFYTTFWERHSKC